MSDRGAAKERQFAVDEKDQISVQYGSPERAKKSALTELDLKTPSPPGKTMMMMMEYDDDAYLDLEQQESKIEMFEEETLAAIEALKTDRDDEQPRREVPKPTEFQPSPIKQKLTANRH